MNYKFELLQELCSVCKDNDIQYYLLGSLMQAAYRGEMVDPEWDSYDLAVTGSGFKKLQEVVSSDEFIVDHPNRMMESLLTNPRFPGFFANYVATDTLHIDFRDDPRWFQNKGLCIHVLIIKNNVAKTRRSELADILRDAYLRTVKHNYDGLKDYIYTLCTRVVFAICGSPLKRKLFRNYINCWKSASKPSGLYLADSRYLTFSRGFWKEALVKTLDGVPFFVPCRFLRRKVLRQVYTLDVIHSDTMSFEDFKDRCHDRNIDLKDIQNQRKKNRDAIIGNVLEGRKSKRFYNAAFFSTLIRHETSEKIDACEVKTLDSPEYYGIIEQYLEDLIEQSKRGVTPYISFGTYIDAMKVFLKNNQEVYHSSRKTVQRTFLKYAETIPDHFFLKSPIVADSCYSAEETEKDAKQLRKELEAALRELALNDDFHLNTDSEEYTPL